MLSKIAENLATICARHKFKSCNVCNLMPLHECSSTPIAFKTENQILVLVETETNLDGALFRKQGLSILSS